MYKKLGIVALVLALALMIAVPAALAQGGPPPGRRARGAPPWGFEGTDVAVGEPEEEFSWPPGAYTVDFDAISFEAEEGLGNSPDTGFVSLEGSGTFPDPWTIFYVQTKGHSPCRRVKLGHPTDPHGWCALAMGFYPATGDILGIVVCTDTPGDDDTIAILLMTEDFSAEYEFAVAVGSFDIY